ncbi:hypothetical protein ACQKFO_21420 [Rossellomorea sp. NPDC071047]|uniref:hypothetical protein n=1 Tax=Rossellomorea sp. NPDC071047 TaxID=3390675 RepID=UPI003CFFD049
MIPNKISAVQLEQAKEQLIKLKESGMNRYDCMKLETYFERLVAGDTNNAARIFYDNFDHDLRDTVHEILGIPYFYYQNIY